MPDRRAARKIQKEKGVKYTVALRQVQKQREPEARTQNYALDETKFPV